MAASRKHNLAILRRRKRRKRRIQRPKRQQPFNSIGDTARMVRVIPSPKREQVLLWELMPKSRKEWGYHTSCARKGTRALFLQRTTSLQAISMNMRKMSASELEMVFLKENYEPIQVNKDGTVQIVLQPKSDWMYIYWETARQWQGHGFAFIHCFKSLRYQE